MSLNFGVEEGVRSYLSSRPDDLTVDATCMIVSAKRLSGGLVNHVWRLTFASGLPVVLKQYPAFVTWNPTLALPQQRSQVEFAALSRMTTERPLNASWSTPGAIFYDGAASVVIMTDAGDHLITFFDTLRVDHGAPPALEYVAVAVAEFIAAVRYVSSAIAPSENMSPVINSMHATAQVSLKKALGDADGQLWFGRSLAARECRTGWIFGDLWPSSVLIDNARRQIVVVDWECSRPGHCGIDVTQMAANLYLMTLGTPFHNAAAQRCLLDFIDAALRSSAYDPMFDYAGAFVGHIAMLVNYPHWELPEGRDKAIVHAATQADALFHEV